MEEIHDRLKAELQRLGLSAAEAARMAGLEDSQGLRDVLYGRKRLSAELLALLSGRCAVDAMYVLMGTPADVGVTQKLDPDEEIVLDNYRNSPPEAKAAIKATSSAFATRRTKQGKAA